MYYFTEVRSFVQNTLTILHLGVPLDPVKRSPGPHALKGPPLALLRGGVHVVGGCVYTWCLHNIVEHALGT